jgi:hypothetical protein
MADFFAPLIYSVRANHYVPWKDTRGDAYALVRRGGASRTRATRRHDPLQLGGVYAIHQNSEPKSLGEVTAFSTPPATSTAETTPFQPAALSNESLSPAVHGDSQRFLPLAGC